MRLNVLALILAAVLPLMATTAFVLAPSPGGSAAFVSRSRTAPTDTIIASQRLYMGMAQPETQIKTGVKTVTKKKQKQAQKQSVKSGEPVQKRKEEFEDAPMYKLMLLQDDGADPEHVITRMCAIMEDLDEDAAATVFQQAQSAGKAMCGKYPFERAELFKEQLLRSTPMIFADMEEENA